VSLYFRLVSRLALAAFCLATWAYGAASYSPFAFDMFIRPRLLPSIAAFVAWHHLWYWGAYLLSAASLALDLPRAESRPRRAARWLAGAYILVFGAIGVHLVTAPYLPTLGNDSRSLVTALASLLPLLWVALVDHLAGWSAFSAASDGQAAVTGQRRLLIVCAATATYIWLIQVVVWSGSGGDTASEWWLGRAWALALSVTTCMIVYLSLSLLSGIAAVTRAPRAWEYVLLVALVAGGSSELVRRIVLRAVSFDELVAIPVSVLTGIALAATWSGLALRRASTSDTDGRTGLEILCAPGTRGTAPAAVALLLLPLLVRAALLGVDRLDWNFVIQKALLIGVWTLAFTLFVRATAGVRGRESSALALVVPPLAALATLYGLPLFAAAIGPPSGGAFHVEAALDRLAARDLAVRLQAGAFVRQPGLDRDYYRYLQRSAASSVSGSTSLPRVTLSKEGRPSGPKPHIFIFVIDSLRRDYLSLYNAAVDFTPSMDRFGRDNFVFTNAFASYGGTWLSMPSLWVGGSVARGWGGTPFDRVNALEQLIVGDGYRLAINDYTVSGYLSKATPSTFLQPEVPSVDTDLCPLLEDLEAHLEPAVDVRPMFAYLAPMNVHLLNTRSGKTLSPVEGYPGFYAPYASRLRRLDACFGAFVSYLKERAIYDDSIIVLTSDHGDSLGENGQWGHQFGLFPEHIRIPLIVHLPEALRTAVTADLSRVAFLTDLAPTLYALVGHEVEDHGPLFGSPLFVPRDREPRPRRRESFLLTSSYGPTYGLLRRNGRSLYVSDVAAGREFAFDLSRDPLGARVDVTDDLRQLNQRLIRQHLEAFNSYHGLSPEP
jgi:hypothetical protein